MSKDNDSVLLALLKEATTVFNEAAAAGSREAEERVDRIMNSLLVESNQRLLNGQKLSTTEKQARIEKNEAFALYVQAEEDRIDKMQQEINKMEQELVEAKRVLDLLDSIEPPFKKPNTS